MTSRIALKEWAAVVDAAGQGRHLLLLRKGGLADPEEGFTLKCREFFLYPTWEHQRPQYVRSEFQDRFRQLAKAPTQPRSQVPVQVYAGVAFHKQIRDPTVLAALEKFHIWSVEFLQQRAAYKPELPTQLLVIRAYRLPRPIAHAVGPEEAGCRSWVDLAQDLSLEGAQPVLENRRFRAALEEIRAKL